MSRFLARLVLLGLLMVVPSLPARGEAKTLARCGEGFLEEVDGYRVLHLKGSPYHMGFQQGVLLREDIRELVRFLFDVKAKEFGATLKMDLGPFGQVEPSARAIIKTIADGEKPFIPFWYFDELRGVADGSGVDLQEIINANFIPELFHCSGFALSGSATKNGTLYHGRVLDYGCDWRLQEHAVLVVAEPEGQIPFVNVTYAGFIGSVTGMNAEHVSLGEMGGRGLGHWAGVPMAVLMRWALQEAHSLEEAVEIFRDHKRTCEYYYVVADGETGRAVGMEASWYKFGTIGMGETHPRLPYPVKDAVLLSAGDRYEELAGRVKAGLGTFDEESARHLMDRPVAMKSNLHCVLFEPKSTRLWVANASKDAEPAATQPYQAFQLSELLTHRADPSAPGFVALPADPSVSANKGR